MLDLWNILSVRLFDVLLGWLLLLPRSIAVLAVGLTTAALLTLIRRWTTNQDRLRRASADMRRLKELKRAAKQAKVCTSSAVGVPLISAKTWADGKLKMRNTCRPFS